MKKVLILSAVLLIVVGGLAWAQDGEKKDEGGGKADISLFTIYILEGGNFNFLIIALSIVTVALIIEHSVTIQRDKLVPPEIIVELEQLVEEEQYEEAMNLCEASRNYITNVVGAALARVGDGFESMVNAGSGAAEEENLKLNQKISWLSLCGNMGPMMGLYGTVIGMVDAFTAIAKSTSTPSPVELAGGIYTALVTTVWGLLVAMPALCAYFIFKNKVQRLTFELSGVAAELIERFKPAAGGK